MTAAELAKIDTEYRESRAAIRADEDLTHEAKERRLRELGREYDRRRKEAERAIADSLEVQEEASYRKAYGPAISTLTPQQETARELRLARIRAEVVDSFEAGPQDPLVSYQRAVRAGDSERAEVIGKVGEKYLRERTRRNRLRELVAENEPKSVKKAKKRLQEVAQEKRSHELGSALHRHVRGREGLSFSDLASPAAGRAGRGGPKRSMERRLRKLEVHTSFGEEEAPAETQERRKEIREQAEHANHCGWGDECGRWPLFEITERGDVLCTHDDRPVTDSRQILAESLYWMEVGWGSSGLVHDEEAQAFYTRSGNLAVSRERVDLGNLMGKERTEAWPRP